VEIIVSKEQARVPVTVLKLSGRLDAASYEQLRAQAEKEITAGARQIAIDLSDVEYISSAGIRALNQIVDLLRRHAPSSDPAMPEGLRAGSSKSPHLKLVNPNHAVLATMKMIGIDMFLDIHQDLKSALSAF